MDKGIKVFVGLDVHKDSISMGVAEACGGEARFVCTLSHDVAKLIKLLARYGQPSEVQVVYEAGPTGYGLYRALIQRGYGCQVIAPSLIPKRAGVRIKTDRRDARKLAELARGGLLTVVRPPSEDEEAVFRALIDVKGVGPRAAQNILSGIEARDLARAVAEGDVARLTKVPGVGKKTAERLVVELKEKLAVLAKLPLREP